MKILVDQNISHRLLPYVHSEFPDLFHVRTLGLIDFSDFEIFKYARKNNFDGVLTLDEDFNNLQLEHGIPPKVIWLRVGNCSTRVLGQNILDKATSIKKFLSDPETECLEIFG